MCGIAGVFGWCDRTVLDDMLTSITHRGPDEEGRYVDRDAPLMMGARRLSIIDLADGSQPIRNEDDSVAVVFNGEIYNHERLRERLEALGHRFSTACDTEVLVHLWEEYGEEMTEHLNGMFAFAVWDETADTLFLARDRLGIKPLYYSETGDGFVWGSELPAVLAAGVDRTLDEKAIYNYFSLRYSPWPRTCLENIKKLPPGSSITVRGDTVERRRYWRLTRKDISKTNTEMTDEIRDRLRESIRLRLSADVPVGAFLSGGLDSTAVIALMSEFVSEDIKTFSIAFENEEYDESEQARYVAEHFGTDHHEYTVDLDSMDIFGKVARHFGEPLADAAILPTTILAERASEEVKVVLTGEGADELFLGYDYYEGKSRHRKVADRLPSFVFDAVGVASKVPSLPNRQQLEYLQTLRSDEETILNYVGGEPERFMTTDLTWEESGLRELVVDSFTDADTTIKKMESFNLEHWLCDDLLYKVDHSTMASSLEARVPFLDHNFVEFVYSIPGKEKLSGGEYKPLLNSATEGLVPDRIRKREKQGFSVPVGEWLKSDKPAIRKWVQPETISDTPFLDTAAVSKLLQQHRAERDDHTGTLWKILNYTAWYHTIVDPSPR